MEENWASTPGSSSFLVRLGSAWRSSESRVWGHPVPPWSAWFQGPGLSTFLDEGSLPISLSLSLCGTVGLWKWLHLTAARPGLSSDLGSGDIRLSRASSKQGRVRPSLLVGSAPTYVCKALQEGPLRSEYTANTGFQLFRCGGSD